MPEFSHLHCHTQFSLLDGAANIGGLFKKAQADGMKGIAITDHGNMFGAFEFVSQAAKTNGAVKAIVGCEFYVVEDRHRRIFTKEDKDKRYHQLFLAKNATGYKNLVKLCSLGYIEGLYGKYPRIDKELILQYHEGLIATTCCIGAMVPQTILKKGEEAGKKEFEWWYNIFGEDYFIELQRHNMAEQDQVNEILIKWSKEYNVPMIATNDSHYIDQKDSNAHDILLCINTGEKQATPAFREFVEEGTIMKNSRFAFWNDQFYFKTQAEMNKLFADYPEACDNTNLIVDRCDTLKLKQDILLPHFKYPDEFSSQDDYLKHITMEGAKKRYKNMTPEVEERINFELGVIRTMGFAGYFLIVADFIEAGRNMQVLIGPGRGSAAGSAVAYCIGITNIDPIKYGLLFERFLNPDRKSMPDIDTDFDDEGRQKVIDYVVEKYGKQQVAHIVTYGTMAAKTSIKDVARVLDLPLADSNALAKLIPDKPGVSLKRSLRAPLDGEGSLKEKEGLGSEDIENIKQLRAILNDEGSAQSIVLKEAEILEGSVRGTGIHAAGIIIAPSDLTDILPVATSKEVDLLITQFEGSVIEDAGVIKMDFLGLRTLTIIRDAIKLIHENHGVLLDPDKLPLDDAKTYELYQLASTNATFQFESAGMQKYLRELKPDKFEDLIAMNALYRPGPLEYIPNFIARKHGSEAISYDLPEMQEYLEETYGITVYQEQVMLLSQKLAGFSKGDADVLRKAMGKKQKEVLDKMKVKFMEGATAKGLDATRLQKIWTDWEAFAQYAFNKSHSTCYAFVAYQTAYLKAHYPAEYMAAVLTNNQGNIEKVSFFLEECQRMNLDVKGPDVNESQLNFSVNKKGMIRYGMGAVKGVGEAALLSIINERKENGPYENIYDFMRRINLRTVNKKVLECLAFAGALDVFNQEAQNGKPALHRAVYFAQGEKPETFLESLIKYGGGYQNQRESSVHSLFGDLGSDAISVPEPIAPTIEPWPHITLLRNEKEVVGIYISGHPLDQYKYEIKALTTCTLNRVEEFKGSPKIQIAGSVVRANHRVSQKGTGYGSFTLQDFDGELEIVMFSEDYAKWKHLFLEGESLFITGKMQTRFNSEELQFKVQDVVQLDSMSHKIEQVTVQIPLHSLSKEVIQKLDQAIATHKGTHTLRMQVLDYQNKMSVQLTSDKRRVHGDTSFVHAMEALGLECKLS
jgi:DNA polymerase III subunit alpha